MEPFVEEVLEITNDFQFDRKTFIIKTNKILGDSPAVALIAGQKIFK
jgi:hypothetical protein